MKSIMPLIRGIFDPHFTPKFQLYSRIHLLKFRYNYKILGIFPSDTSWNSQMVEYSFIVIHKGTTYMFYNRNDYGKTGFGYAVLEK